ncbi:MAG: hypothetical protein HY321_11705 [Armatimonadetes bacterium]|nr:hypothetical protein [Armatimonadota bacterium]
MEPAYINTDLDLESAGDLSPILDEFGEEVFVLFHGSARGYDLATLEVAAMDLSADGAVARFCHLVGNLSEESRGVWDACVSRTFDIGYESGESGARYRSELRPETVRQAAAVGAGILVTIYPVRWGEGQRAGRDQTSGRCQRDDQP